MSDTEPYREKKKVSERKPVCPECGAVFETTQALGSHRKYTHERKKNAPRREGLDLKEAFIDLLRDVGVRRGARTIAEIYFGTGADSMENLDQVLRLAGVSNPARSLVLRRWGQRVNKQVGESLLRDKNLGQSKTGDFFETYERMRESELQELLMEDIRTRINERRKKRESSPKDEDTVLRMINKLSAEVRQLKLSQTISRPLATPQRPSQLPPQSTRGHAHHCDDPYHSASCVVCGRCGFHGSIARIPIDEDFVCPMCRASYVRDH